MARKQNGGGGFVPRCPGGQASGSCRIRAALVVLLGLCAVVDWRLVVHAADDAAPAAEKASKSLSSKDRSRATKLRTVVTAGSPTECADAIAELQALGPGAQSMLKGAIRQALTQDKKKIDKAAGTLKNPAPLEAAWKELVETRRLAWENIKVIENAGAVEIAEQHYKKLGLILQRLHEAFAIQSRLVDLLTRRRLLMDNWKTLVSEKDNSFPEKAETNLWAKAEQSLGGPLPADLPAFGTTRPDSLASALWFYRDCRQVEAFNATQTEGVTPGEVEDVVALNTYREALALLPLELDHRLTESSRGHCHEMVDLNYFAHESPTPERKTPYDRMRLAGYVEGGGENILQGAINGVEAFELWFKSPHHHENMVHEPFTAVGVGEWREHWAQNFGTGKRLMLLSPDERAAVLASSKKPASSP